MKTRSDLADNLLGLKDICVIDVMKPEEAGKPLIIKADSTDCTCPDPKCNPSVCKNEDCKNWLACKKDKKKPLSRGSRHLVIVDVPAQGRPVEIHLRQFRYRCPCCGKTFSAQLPSVSSVHRMTRRAHEAIAIGGLKRPLLEISKEFAVCQSTVRSIVAEVIVQLDSTVPVQAPRYLGIDECHLYGGARAVFTDLEHGKVIDIAEGYSQAHVAQRLLKMQDLNRVEVVAIDMCAAYRDVIYDLTKRGAFKPTIVIDKRHVLELVRRPMDKLRKAMQDKERRVHRKKADRITRRSEARSLNVRRHRLSCDQKLLLDARLANAPELKQVYDAKEAFSSIFQMNCREAAEKKFITWKEALPELAMGCLKQPIDTIETWKEEIFAYFDHKVTNACTEALNGRIKVVYREGRRNTFAMLRGRVLHRHGPWTAVVVQTAVRGVIAQFLLEREKMRDSIKKEQNMKADPACQMKSVDEQKLASCKPQLGIELLPLWEVLTHGSGEQVCRS